MQKTTLEICTDFRTGLPLVKDDAIVISESLGALLTNYFAYTYFLESFVRYLMVKFYFYREKIS